MARMETKNEAPRVLLLDDVPEPGDEPAEDQNGDL